VDTGSRPGSEQGWEAIAIAADRVLRFPLTSAGYEFDPVGGWSWSNADAFVAVSTRVVGSVESGGVLRPGGVALTFGWAYGRFGDREPFPRSAEGCVRQLAIDDFAGDVWPRLAALPAGDEVEGWEQRLATTVRKEVVGWLETWKRPDGFRDFLSHRRLHLSAAWLSGLLGHRERVDLELHSTAGLMGIPLGSGFDRRRADRDEAFAAPAAARHGLAAFLARAESEGDRTSLDAFGGQRASLAKDRVTDPATEHARLIRRHEVYSALCLEYLEASTAAR
jgi:hypothetical protein